MRHLAFRKKVAAVVNSARHPYRRHAERCRFRAQGHQLSARAAACTSSSSACPSVALTERFGWGRPFIARHGHSRAAARPAQAAFLRQPRRYWHSPFNRTMKKDWYFRIARHCCTQEVWTSRSLHCSCAGHRMVRNRLNAAHTLQGSILVKGVIIEFENEIRDGGSRCAGDRDVGAGFLQRRRCRPPSDQARAADLGRRHAPVRSGLVRRHPSQLGARAAGHRRR